MEQLLAEYAVLKKTLKEARKEEAKVRNRVRDLAMRHRAMREEIRKKRAKCEDGGADEQNVASSSKTDSKLPSTTHASSCSAGKKSGSLKRKRSRLVQPKEKSNATKAWDLWEMAKRKPHAMADASGVESLINFIQNNFDDDRVIEYSFGALITLAGESYVPENESAFGAILKAMRSHPKDAFVQNNGCALLEQYAEDKEWSRLIVKIGGVETLADAMKTHGSDHGIHERAVGALHWLVHSSDNTGQFVEAFKKCNVLDYLTAAKNRHPSLEEKINDLIDYILKLI